MVGCYRNLRARRAEDNGVVVTLAQSIGLSMVAVSVEDNFRLVKTGSVHEQNACVRSTIALNPALHQQANQIPPQVERAGRFAGFGTVGRQVRCKNMPRQFIESIN